MTRRLATIGLSLAILAGCAGPAGGSAGSGGAMLALTVLAAASLATPLDQLRSAWEASRPGVSITVATDSSTALRVQIEQGAPADLLLSADSANPAALAAAGLTDGAPVPFAGNRLTIIVPDANPASIDEPSDLARAGVRIVAAGREVPLTGYATRVLNRLATLPGYRDGFAAACEANVVSREDNARAVVARVELGEADAGIVYLSDAVAADRVTTIPIPDEANVTAVYAGVVVRGARHPQAARDFLAWIAGPDGHAILAEVGFTAPPA